MTRISVPIIAAVCLVFCVSKLPSFSQIQKPAEQPDDKVHAGQDTFNKYCLQCHSPNEGQDTFGPSLHGEMKKPHPKTTLAEVRLIIDKGKGKMPSFADRLTAEDTDNLIAYLRTL